MTTQQTSRVSTATVTSKDGTKIAFSRVGSGPALILVGGAVEQRALETETAKLAAHPLLSEHFTVYNYDRRGRGSSGDTLPYAVEREVEDIEALVDDAGGAAYLFGISSGAALAMEAAAALAGKVKKLAMYEAPYNSDEEARKNWRAYRKDLDEILEDGRPGDAMIRFMMLVGMPEEHAPGVRHMPEWPMFEAVAPTLAYDAAVLGEEAAVPVERAAQVRVPALVMSGSESYPFMHTAAVALAEAMPQGEQRTLEGQTHEVSPDALAPILVEFFNS
jgi:pimeloyl-ACP methyl ester carboxylesterase